VPQQDRQVEGAGQDDHSRIACDAEHSSELFPVLWIDHGTIQAFGDPDETVERYLRTVHDHETR
jgi:hypothetical protein